jgi:cytochrome c5
MSVTLTSRLALILAATSAGIAFAQAPTPAPPPAAKPPAAKPAATAPDPKDVALVERMCSGCHEFGTVSSQNRTDTEWAETLDRMTGYGAQMTPADQKQIQAFLTAHYGKKAD